MKSCFWSLDRLPGLPARDREALAKLNITNTQQLLRRGATAADRQTMARTLHLREHHIHKWVAMADLARVPSVGSRHCGLLLHAGISSTTQLARATAGSLHRDLVRFHVALYKRRDWCPTLPDAERWIEEARQLLRTWHQRPQASASQHS